MRTFYLVSALFIAVLILVLSFAQSGAVCTWYIFNANASPIFVLLQTAGLGAVMGGLLVLVWKIPGKKKNEAEEDEMSSE